MSTFRYRIIQIFFSIIFLLILARLFDLQIIQGQSLREETLASHKKRKKDVLRAEIIDRNEQVLALDVIKYRLEYNPIKTNEDLDQLGRKLNRIFGFTDYGALRGRQSKIISHKLTSDQAKAIQKLNSKVLYLNKNTSRYYPQDSLASHLLGYVDLFGRSILGLESFYHDNLTESRKNKLQLSLDSRLQNFAEIELAKHIKKTKAKRGTVIVMKIATGEIFAWATKPDFNPNSYYKFTNIDRKNWSLVDIYQPGSIFKIITVASALDSGTINEDYTYYDEGFIKVDKWKVKNHGYNPKKFKAETLSLQNLFESSSNTFASHLALEMGAQNFHTYIDSFGFAHETGIELHGEAQGILSDFKKWRKSDLATTGMGHGSISVTPLQLITAVNSVINKGYWIRPTLLKNSAPVTDGYQVISPEVAIKVRKLLVASLQNNLAKKETTRAGRVEALIVGGKTGTTQKLKAGGGYSKINTIASFLGFMPGNNPEYIALVVIDDPETDGRWGDTVAGPLFNKIAAYLKNLYL